MKDRNNGVPIVIKVFAISKLLFVIGYFSYLLYVAFAWGFGERITLVFIADSVYLLLIVSGVGMLLKQKWSWWMTMIIFIKLFIAKLLSMVAEVVNILTGMVAETITVELFLGDFLILILFIAIITFLSLPMIRDMFEIKERGSKIALVTGIGAIILYIIYFTIMLIMISALL